MGDFDPAFVHELATQSWSFYGVGMFLILLRMYARIHRLGIRQLQTDDYLMVLVGCLYTILIVCLNVISGGGGSNLYLPDEFDTFTAEDIRERIHGSKIVLVSEQAMLNVIYTIKACMLIMYTRLTLGLKAQRWIFFLAIYVCIGWCATQIAFFTACTPFKGYWAMPPPDPQCTTLQHYAIIQGCFNISSDTLMLCIALPLMTRLNVPWKQKAILIVIFSMGIFVIVAAILTKVFNLSNIWDPTYMLWYTREASVAVYVSNIPMIWPLMREWFPVLRDLSNGHKISEMKRQGYAGSDGSRTGNTIVITGQTIGTSGGGITTTTTIHGKGESTEELSSWDETEMHAITKESWEDYRPAARIADRPLKGWDGDLAQHGIHMSTTVQISEQEIDDGMPQIPKSILPPRDLEEGIGDFDFGPVYLASDLDAGARRLRGPQARRF